jgi:hypothetical protein
MAARGRGRGRGRGAPNPPPPITMEELMNTQNQMMQMFMQHLQNNPLQEDHRLSKLGTSMMNYWKVALRCLLMLLIR